MKSETLSLLACPMCGSPLKPTGSAGLDVDQAGALACPAGHSFPVIRGIPRFLVATGTAESRAIHESFSSEWTQHDYATDRVWGQTLDQRREIALRELDCEPGELRGKLVLDAGCGAGMLAYLLTDMGARVLAADISSSVDTARAQLARMGADDVDFIQADLTRPPLRRGSFDIVFSGGVLHHNPDTRTALEALTPLVAPGGQIYVWLYGKTPGLAHRVRALLRRVIVPLPSSAQRAIFRVWAAQSVARQSLRKMTGRARPSDGVTYREKMVILLDHYTPRYRWEHTPEELSGWYRELGFTDIKTTELTEYGFGVLARRAAVPAEPVLEAAGVAQP